MSRFALSSTGIGDFFRDTANQILGTEERGAVLEAICTAATPSDVQGCATGIESAGFVSPLLEKQRGYEYTGVIKVDPEEEICRAYLITNDFSATSNTDTSMTLRENGNGPRAELGWYAAIGSNQADTFVRYQVVLEVVPRGSKAPRAICETRAGRCGSDQMRAWSPTARGTFPLLSIGLAGTGISRKNT